MRIQNDCLKAKKIFYLFFGLFLIPCLLIAQSGLREIKGVIKDDKGAGVSGATVAVKSTGLSTASATTGSFTISASEGDTLVISSVSFTSTMVPVTKESFYNVSMSTTAAALNDVVVVGYGRSSRKTLTSAITTVKPEDLNRGAISDVGQLLQGKVPGLNISTSGDPNRPAAVIMRGASTINSPSGPFYVIDGVPGADISLIAPDDIASIDVLKDAAATAIYGNRAANGIIMVTTKKGRKGVSQVSYSGYISMEKTSRQLEMMDTTELRAFLRKNNVNLLPTDDKGASTNWQEAVQRNSAISHNHNLSLSGGGEHGSYTASVNYFKRDGILLGSDLTRVIGRLAVDQYFINDKVHFALSVTNSNSNANNTPNRNVVLQQMVSHLPVSPIKNANGTYFENLNTTGYFNPVAIIEQAQDNTKNNNLLGTFNTTVQLPFGLQYNLNLSYQSYTTQHGEYYGAYYSRYANFYNNPDPPAGRGLINFGTNGSALRYAYQNTAKIAESFLTWNRKFGDHAINAVVGYSYQENVNGDGFQASSTNFPVDNISFNNLALGNPYAVSGYRVNFGNTNIYQKTKLISDFGRLNYNYREKYLIQGSIRRDGSSVFGANNHWGYFPAVGIAWRINQESFMQNQSIFSDLKLRVSYGITGNAFGFDAYTAQNVSSSLGTFYYNGQQLAAYGPAQAENADLRWEKLATANIGVDFSILKGKLSGSIEVYRKKTSDMIYSYPVNPILIPTGSITANGGSMVNKGIELTLNATPVQTKNFVWTSSLNLASNQNKITSLSNPLFAGGDSVRLTQPDGQGQTGSTLQILKVGQPLGTFFTLDYAGKNATGLSQYYRNDKTLTTSPRIGNDYIYAGNPQPTLLAGFTNTFRYKTWDLNIFLRGVFGNKIFNATRADLFRPSTAQYTNILKDVANELTSDANAFKYSTRFVENGSYVRLDNATLGYTIRNLGAYIKNIRMYASVNNAFVITSYTGIDPEINQGGIAPGIDVNNFYPRTRTMLLGVNVTF